MAKAQSRPIALSAYRIMWMFVLFDLPVMTPKQRKAASRFRLDLLDMGFEMAQFSVYLRFCSGKDQTEVYAKKIEALMPSEGKVHFITITDKQYGNIKTFRGKKREQSPKNPNQLSLF